MKIEVYASQTHVTEKDLRGKNCVVIDTLRATSTIITALANGCEQVIPVEEVGQATQLRISVGESVSVLGGERDGQKIPGFDLGNSPLEYGPEHIYGKTLILTTTNGTLAIRKAEAAMCTYIGAMINATFIARALLKTETDAVLLCAGTEGKFAVEDVLSAGYIIHCLRRESQGAPILVEDLAYACEVLYENSREDLMHAAQYGKGYQNLQALGMGQDVTYCLQQDTVPALPLVQDNRIILARQ